MSKSFSVRLQQDSSSSPPPGVSRVHTLYAFATQAENLGARASARQAYDALASLHLPRAWRDAVDRLDRMQAQLVDPQVVAVSSYDAAASVEVRSSTPPTEYLRQVEQAKEFIRADLPPLPPFENDAAQPGDTRSGKKDFSNTSGQFIVDYFFTDDINSYFKYATGYRSGGFSTRSLVTEFADGFEPETVQSYELGFKSQLWERRLRLNAAAYYNDYTDLQVDTYIPLANGRTLNAGQATIQGVEIEAVARLTRGLTVDAFYAFMDADYDEYIDNGVDLSGVKKVPQAPRNQAKGGVEYAFPMTGLGQITARLDYLWTDEFWSNPDSNNRNDAYGLLNARVQWLGIPLPAGDIRVALWGKNLTDEEYTVLTTDFSGGDNNPVDAFRTVAAQYGTPRTYGLDFIYEY